MTTCIHYYYCKCDVLFSITSIFSSSIFSFMFSILFVATATLDGLLSYRTVLNCFHWLWLYLLYPLLGWLCRLPGWFYSIAFTYSYTCITFNLYYCYITVLPLPTLCPLPPLCYHIYIYIYIYTHTFFLRTNNFNSTFIDLQMMEINLQLM